jgi:predicted nucleic acid-binding protein
MIEHPPTDLVITDSGPLIHLDELDCLDLLKDFKQIMVPDAVWREVQVHRPASLQSAQLNLLRSIVPNPSPPVDALTPLYGLHSGEREALILCLAYPLSTLLTDDTAARLAAKTLNIPAHGTIGILVRAIRRHRRTKTEILELLSSIPLLTTLHVRPAFLAEVIRDIEQRVEI